MRKFDTSLEAFQYAVDLLSEHPEHAPPQLFRARDVLIKLLEDFEEDPVAFAQAPKPKAKAAPKRKSK